MTQRKPSHAWLALCALLIAATGVLWWLTAGGDAWAERLSWHADRWPRQLWTLWSAPLVHRIAVHALANALALAALAVLGEALAAPPRAALALLLAWPAGTLALARWPAVTGFYGLSGVVHAAAAILAAHALCQRQTRWIGALLAAGLLLKLALEGGGATPIGFDSAWGFNVVYAAHLSGALAGLTAWGLIEALARAAPPVPLT